MGITRNAAPGGYIDRKGEYRVKVTEAKSGLSKGGKRMLTVTFQTKDERSIKSYFVADLIFHMKSLVALKLASGLTERDQADKLVGREVGILVEPQSQRGESGTVFMHITGYGKASDVDESAFAGEPSGGEGPPDDFMPPHSVNDEVPF